MANPTTNYGFVLPTPTDLVTDLPADFDVALQGVDTRLKALQPGTTAGDLAYSSATANTNVRLGIGTSGQVLSVVAGVPAWANDPDQTPLTTKGDIFTFSTLDARLPVGTNGQVLTCDSTQSTGLKYATPASGGGKVLQVVTAAFGTSVSNSTTTFTDTGLTATITPATSGSRILVMVSHTDCFRGTTATSGLKLQIMRGTTIIATNGTTGDEQDSSSNTMIFATQLLFLDSPATTSATTYKTQLANFVAGGSVRVNFNSTAGTSQIVLMEIGA